MDKDKKEKVQGIPFKKNGLVALSGFYAAGGAIVYVAGKYAGFEMDGTFVLGALGVMSGLTMIVLQGTFTDKPGDSEEHREKMKLAEVAANAVNKLADAHTNIVQRIDRS